METVTKGFDVRLANRQLLVFDIQELYMILTNRQTDRQTDKRR